MSFHGFDSDVAEEHGVAAALLIHHFQFWIRGNLAHDRNMKEGRTWSFGTVDGLAKIYPYLTRKQVRVALEHLLEVGILMKGNFNPKAYDRTCWYAFVDQDMWVNPLKSNICPPGPMDLPSGANGFALQGQPIPDTKTDTKKDTPLPPKGVLTRELNQEFEAWWKIYPEKTGKKYAAKCFKTARKEASIEQLLAGLQTYISTKPPERAWCHPSTWLNQGRWADEVGPKMAAGDGVVPEALTGRRKEIYDQMIAEGTHAGV
jgi:hypothetical protein